MVCLDPNTFSPEIHTDYLNLNGKNISINLMALCLHIFIVCLCLYTYVCIYLHICIYVYMNLYIHMQITADLYAKYTYKCMCILEHTHIHTRVHITACVCLREHLRPPPRRPPRMQLSLGVSN